MTTKNSTKHARVSALAAAFVLGVAGMMAAAPPAAANTMHVDFPDAAGDAPRGIDIVRLTATASATKVRFRLDVRSLAGTGRLVLDLGTGTDWTGEDLEVTVRKKHRRVKVTYSHMYGDPMVVGRACKGARIAWSPRHGVISGRIPLATCGGWAGATKTDIGDAVLARGKRADRVERPGDDRLRAARALHQPQREVRFH